MNPNIIQKAKVLINKPGLTATIALIDEEGRPCVSAISSICCEGIDVCWFATNTHGRKARLISKNPKAGICYMDGGNVSLTGKAEIITDPLLKKEMWMDGFEGHFAGIDDENYCLIKVTVEHVRLYIDDEAADFNICDILDAQSYCGLMCDGCDYRVRCNCGKCLPTGGVPFHGKCTIATSAIEKGYAHCGMCPDMPCDKLYNYSCEDGEHCDNPKGARLEMLKYWTKTAK